MQNCIFVGNGNDIIEVGHSDYSGWSEAVLLEFRSPFCGRLDTGYSGLILHELFHVLGAYHTHLRPDRDQHVAILRSGTHEDNGVSERVNMFQRGDQARKNGSIFPKMRELSDLQSSIRVRLHNALRVQEGFRTSDVA